MKTLVTHRSPDLDAITSMWLLIRHHHGWDNPDFAFVLAGKTLNDADPDDDPSVIHVDTGLGKFDHHQLKERTSAARLVLEFLKVHGHIRKSSQEPLERIVDVVTVYDNFGEAKFDTPAADVWNFSLNEVINGVKSMVQDDERTVRLILPMLDGLLVNMKNKLGAEAEMERGFITQTKYGKSLFIETKNDEAMKLALKSGFKLVVRKDPDRGFVRIKTFPEPEYDLTPLDELVRKADPKASWYLHNSKNMLLNGSSKNLDVVTSTLSLQRLIEIVKQL